MLIPIALVVGLLIATAIIAHVADNLGKKLGKKRVSLFGLRPRTSATLATVGSGWAIMLFTLFVLLMVVTPLRNALLHYESVVQQIKDAQTELSKKQADLSRTQADLTKAQQHVAQFREQAQTFKISADKSQEQAHLYQEQAQDFQGKAQKAQSSLAVARRGEQSARRGAQAAQRTAATAQVSARSAQSAERVARAQQQAALKTLASTKVSLGVIQSRLALNQSRLKVAQSQLKTAQSRLLTTRRQLLDSYREIVQVQKESQQQVQEAQQKVQAAQRDVQEAQQQVQLAKDDVARFQEEVKTLQIQKIGLQQQAEVFTRFSASLAFGDISLSVEQILAERRFDATRSSEEIERELRIIVAQAVSETHKVLGTDKVTVAVGTSITGESGEPIDLNEEQTIKFYADLLSSANMTVSARLISASNYPSTTELVEARFVFVPIRTIYLARQDIKEGVIDTNKSESAIFRQLQDLVEDARKVAVKDGARPPVIPDPQTPTYFFDGDTGPKMFEALRQIQKFDHPVRVRIVAARDLDSAEPLQIRFIVGEQA